MSNTAILLLVVLGIICFLSGNKVHPLNREFQNTLWATAGLLLITACVLTLGTL